MEEGLDAGHTIERLQKQYIAYTRGPRKKTDLQTNLQPFGLTQHEVPVAFKEPNDAKSFSITEKEEILLAIFMSWKHKAKDITNRLFQVVNQQLINTPRDGGSAFFAYLVGLKAANID